MSGDSISRMLAGRHGCQHPEGDQVVVSVEDVGGAYHVTGHLLYGGLSVPTCKWCSACGALWHHGQWHLRRDR